MYISRQIISQRFEGGIERFVQIDYQIAVPKDLFYQL